MEKDIAGFEDIVILVDAFYEKIRRSSEIGYIFEEVLKGDWESHLPRMYQFWESVLFATGAFKGNPMQKHLSIHAQIP